MVVGGSRVLAGDNERKDARAMQSLKLAISASISLEVPLEPHKTFGVGRTAGTRGMGGGLKLFGFALPTLYAASIVPETIGKLGGICHRSLLAVARNARPA